MNEFTASNGFRVQRDKNENVQWLDPHDPNWTGRIDRSGARALAEFFRAEEDERLARWRWPENPDYVVYAWVADPPRRDIRGVTVLSETIPRGYTVWEDRIDTLYGTSIDEASRRNAREAARAYFDAHPEPKPWYDAKPGEVWELTHLGGASAYVFTDQLSVAQGVEPAFLGGRAVLYVRDDEITAGRRIWPEVQS
jgi:hypothetical protein